MLSNEEKDWLIMMLTIAVNYSDSKNLFEDILTVEEEAIILPIMDKIENMVAEEEKEEG